MFGWEFILLTVVHTTWGKVLSSLDISASRSLWALTAAEEGECSENDVSETHYTDGGDEPDDETLVLTAFARVEIVLHIAFVDVVAGSAIGRRGRGGVGVCRVVGSGPA